MFVHMNTNSYVTGITLQEKVVPLVSERFHQFCRTVTFDASHILQIPLDETAS